jgi:hypothetical protein
MVKAEFKKKKTPLTSKFNLGLRKKLLKGCNCGIRSLSGETWRLRKIVAQYLEDL